MDGLGCGDFYVIKIPVMIIVLEVIYARFWDGVQGWIWEYHGFNVIDRRTASEGDTDPCMGYCYY